MNIFTQFWRLISGKCGKCGGDNWKEYGYYGFVRCLDCEEFEKKKGARYTANPNIKRK